MGTSTRNIVENFADRLREIRERAGMSRSQLAVRIVPYQGTSAHDAEKFRNQATASSGHALR